MSTSDRLRRILLERYRRAESLYVGVVARGIPSELAKRQARRGHGQFRWFVPEEAHVAEALASIVVPSDDETPGNDEIGVLGAPAVDTLDQMIANCTQRQRLYSRGLLAFDIWATREFGATFPAISRSSQLAIFEESARMNRYCTGGGSMPQKLWHRLECFAKQHAEAVLAADLYPHVRRDCLQVFYTSRVSWVWLEFDGPPMDKGYPSVTQSRVA